MRIVKTTIALVLGAALAFLSFGEAFAGETQKQLTSESVIQTIMKRSKLKVGMSTFVPWAMRNKKGELIGFEIDVAKKVAEDMRVKIEFVPTPSRHFSTIRVDIDNSTDPTRTIVNALADHDLKDKIIRVIYRSTDPITLDFPMIRRATEDTALVAGIYPDTERTIRQRRSTVTQEMGLKKALEAYIDNTSRLASLKEDMVSRALALEAEELTE